MYRKYNYFVNGKKMQRKEFISELKKCCRRVVRTDEISDWFCIDLCEFDKKKFNKEMRYVEKDMMVIFPDYNKTFYRKEIQL